MYSSSSIPVPCSSSLLVCLLACLPAHVGLPARLSPSRSAEAERRIGRMPNGPPVADDGCSMYCSGAIIPELCMKFSSEYNSDLGGSDN
jgi:hypothetical protein